MESPELSEIRGLRPGDRTRVHLTLNGKAVSGLAEPRLLLADFIRDELGARGTKVGCEHGVCGACTVLFNGHPVRSCLTLAVQAEGAALVTVEGLAAGDQLHPIQQAFMEEHALQCGFCTSGMLLTTWQILQDNANPEEDAIRQHLSGNLCRCTGYHAIVAAVQNAVAKLHGA